MATKNPSTLILYIVTNINYERSEISVCLCLCQIEDEREYNQKVCRDGDKYGLPHRIIPKQPIAVNHSK